MRSILTTVTEALAADASRRFIWAETVWFKRWWLEQSSATQDVVRRLVASGQLEFAGGGWAMNDEVIAHYQDVVDQVTTGHEFLQATLGPMARVRHGWQIDMFTGYSVRGRAAGVRVRARLTGAAVLRVQSVTPSLWSLMGYDGSVIRFAGYEAMRNLWNQTRAFQYLWVGSRNLNEAESAQFMHVIGGNYGDLIVRAPRGGGAARAGRRARPLTRPGARCAQGQGFNFEDNNATTNPPITPDNIAARAAALANVLWGQAQIYRGPLLTVWGSDFRFVNAHRQFGNMTQLVNYITAHQEAFGMRVRFSTLREYFDALYEFAQRENIRFPRFENLDFEIGWPHVISGYNTIEYQTGALSSRPTFKGMIRATEASLRSAEHLYALALSHVPASKWREAGAASWFPLLQLAREATAVVQHHDSLACTMATAETYTRWLSDADVSRFLRGPPSDQHVLEDYERMLSEAQDAADRVRVNSLKLLLSAPLRLSPRMSSAEAVSVVLHNTLSWTRREIASVQLPDTYAAGAPGAIAVQDSTGRFVLSQWDTAAGELLFEALVPAMGYATFRLMTASDATAFPAGAAAVHTTTRQYARLPPGTRGGYAGLNAPVTLRNAWLEIVIDNESGEWIRTRDRANGMEMQTRQRYYTYVNGTGAAYLLVEPYPIPLSVGPPASVTFNTGPLAREAVLNYAPWLQQRIRLYGPENGNARSPAWQGGFVEVRHDAGPLPMRRELIVRYETDLQTRGKRMFTDNSGMEMHARDYHDDLILPASYHSMVAAAYIREEPLHPRARQLTLLTRQTVGVMSGRAGQLEAMLHRRLNSSDHQGPWPLDDRVPVRIVMYVLANTTEGSERVRHRLQLQLENPLVAVFGVGSEPGVPRLEPLTRELPEQLHAMTFQVRAQPDSRMPLEFVLRLHHLFEREADAELRWAGSVAAYRRRSRGAA